MRLTHPLHLGALLIAVAALFWGLTAFVGILFVLAFLAGLAGAILLAGGRGVPPELLGRVRGAAGALIAVHTVLIVLFILATPVNLGEDPSTGFNLEPHPWITAAMDFYVTSLLVLLLALLLPLSVLTISSGTLERGLAAAGAGAVVLVVVFGLIGIGMASDGFGMLMSTLFLLGFAAIAVATFLPPWQATQPPWSEVEAARTPSAKTP